MKELIVKENNIFDILQKFIDAKLDFVIVGGYAVSSYKHRFSVDAGIVIQSKDLENFESILKKEKFKKGFEKDLDNPYASRFMRYEKDSASIDLLIDGIASRTTNASFGYNLLLENSSKRKIMGIEKEIAARVPSKELLIIMKVHSGRLTDFRDIAAIAKEINFETVRKLIFIGDLKVLQENLDKLNKVVHDKNFIDSFKGVFIEKKFDVDLKQVEKISKLKKN